MANTTFVSKVTVIPTAWLQDLNDAYYLAKDFSSAGVTTRSVQSPSGLNLRLNAGASASVLVQLNGSTAYAFDLTQFVPQQGDNVQNIGAAALRWAKVFTPIIDSGTTGSLTFKLNNGEAILDLIRPAGVIANRWTMQGGISGSNGVSLFPTGGDANISAFYTSRGTGVHTFQTDIAAPVVQFQVLHTASSSRNITVTGSNGGNPTIGVTAGSLAITPAVVMASTLKLGTNPASVGQVNIPYGTILSSRNNANSLDITLIGTATTGGVVDVLRVGGAFPNSVGVLVQGRFGAGAPALADIPAESFTVWRDTVGLTTKLYYNNSGTLQSVALT